MTGTEWTALAWKLIIAVAPIIVSVVVKLITDVVAKMSTTNREKLEYWVNVFVKAAQMVEPDPAKRKAWVMEQVLKLFPTIDPDNLSALIEAVVASLKLDNLDWNELPPVVETVPAPTV